MAKVAPEEPEEESILEENGSYFIEECTVGKSIDHHIGDGSVEEQQSMLTKDNLDSASVIAEGDAVWRKYWKKYFTADSNFSPILGEVTCVINRVSSVNLNHETYDAKIFVAVRVKSTSFLSIQSPLLLNDNQEYYIAAGHLAFAPWNPLTQIEGLTLGGAPDTWIKTGGEFIDYFYEAYGSINMNIKSPGFWFPFHNMDLKISITSGWTSEQFKFVPHGYFSSLSIEKELAWDNWDFDGSEVGPYMDGLSAVEVRGCNVLRRDYSVNSSLIMEMKEKQRRTNTQFQQFNNCIVCFNLQHKAAAVCLLEWLRPVSLTSVAFCSFSIAVTHENAMVGRQSMSMSIIVANSISLSTRKREFIGIIDIHMIVSFVLVCCISFGNVIATTKVIYGSDPQGMVDRAELSDMIFNVLGAFWILFNLFYLFLFIRSRHLFNEVKKYRSRALKRGTARAQFLQSSSKKDTKKNTLAKSLVATIDLVLPKKQAGQAFSATKRAAQSLSGKAKNIVPISKKVFKN